MEGYFRKRLWIIIYSVLTATILSFVAGLAFGFASPTVLELSLLEDDEKRFDATLLDIFGASSMLGSIIGAPIAGYLVDRYGRKTSLATNVIPYLLGYLMILSSYLVEDGIGFKIFLILGRLIAGIGQGWTYVVVPIYISEITPPKIRGFFVNMSETIITIGILTMIGLGSVPHFHYYHTVLFPIGSLVPFMFMLVWIPETPRWLLLYFKDKKRAIAAMKHLMGPKISAESHLQEIQSAVKLEHVPLRKTLKKLFFQKDVFIPFMVAMFVVVLQQLCGVGPVIGYASQTFHKAGSPNPDLTAFLAGLILLPSTIVAGVLVEVVGRKILLAVSTFGMFVSQGVVGLQFFLTRPSLCASSNVSGILEDSDRGNCFPNLYPVAIAGVALFGLFFATGVGPVSWIVFTEYLPLEVKGVAGGIVLSANRAAGILLLGTFSNYSQWAGDWTAWWTLSSFNLISFVCVLVFVVETKGKTLEQVPDLFKKYYNFGRGKQVHENEENVLTNING